MANKLKCVKCGREIDAPQHCGQAMHTQEVNGQTKLVCHMGPGCSTTDVPTHCGVAMREA
jgi:hypothetical protein